MRVIEGNYDAYQRMLSGWRAQQPDRPKTRRRRSAAPSVNRSPQGQESESKKPMKKRRFAFRKVVDLEDEISYARNVIEKTSVRTGRAGRSPRRRAGAPDQGPNRRGAGNDQKPVRALGRGHGTELVSDEFSVISFQLSWWWLVDELYPPISGGMRRENTSGRNLLCR